MHSLEPSGRSICPCASKRQLTWMRTWDWKPCPSCVTTIVKPSVPFSRSASLSFRGNESESISMRYLHTMVRVKDLGSSLDFYCNQLGLQETRRYEVESGRFTLVFVAAPQTPNAEIELTYNWDPQEYPA